MAQEFEAIQPAALSMRAISSNSWLAGVGAISRPPNARGIQVRKMPASTMAVIAVCGRFRSARSQPSGARPVTTARTTTLTEWAVPLYSYSAGVRREAIQRANDRALSPLRRPASSPSTPICSSRSGHSIAYPSPSNSQCCRSAGDPCTRRGYHASGTIRLRPSARSTVNLSSVTVTCTMPGSVSSTKVVMPRLKESYLVLHHKSCDTAYLVCAKAAIGHKRHRLQPELGHGPLPLHMDVRRFPAVRAEENETVRPITKYGRHRATLLVHMFLYSEERFYAEKRKVATEAEHPR